MTDYAAYFREVLYTKEDLAALDALVAERDEAIEKHRLLLYDFGAYQVEAKAKKSEMARLTVCVAELEAALTRYRGGTPRKEGDAL